MTQVNQMFLLNNCQDLALKLYHLARPGAGRPQALGLRGPTWVGPEHAAKIHMRDVGRYVGAQHDLFRYLCAPGAAGQVWAYTAGEAYSEMHLALGE
jgi:hypothetical protein